MTRKKLGEVCRLVRSVKIQVGKIHRFVSPFVKREKKKRKEEAEEATRSSHERAKFGNEPLGPSSKTFSPNFLSWCGRLGGR